MALAPILLIEDSEPFVHLLSRAFKQAEVENPLITFSSGVNCVDYLNGDGVYADRK